MRAWKDRQVVAGILVIVAVATLVQFTGYRGLDRIELAGLPLSTYQNAFLLLATAVAALQFGVRRWINPVIAAYGLMLLMSFTLSSRLPELSPLQSIRTFCALVIAPLLFEVRLPGWVERWLRRIVPWLALGNLALSLIILLVLAHPIHRTDWGAFRLTGTLVPAGLSKLALAALLFSLLAARRQPRWLWLALANLGIVVWSGTRAGILAGVLLSYGWIVSEVLVPAARSRLRHRVAFGLLIPLIVLSYAPFAVSRFGGFWTDKPEETLVVQLPSPYEEPDLEPGSEESGVDEGDKGFRLTMTGRVSAWTFYYDLAQENLWFGRGIGAGVVGSFGHLHETFRLPHNEYLRFLVDGGIVGMAAVVLAHLWMFVRLMVRSHSRSVRLLVLLAFGVLAADAFLSNTFAVQPFIVPFWLYLAFLTREEPRELHG